MTEDFQWADEMSFDEQLRLERLGADTGINPMFGEWQQRFGFEPVLYPAHRGEFARRSNVSYCLDDVGNLLGKSVGTECVMSGNVIQIVDGTCSSMQAGGDGSFAAPESTTCSMPSPLYIHEFDDRNRLSKVTFTDGSTPGVTLAYTGTDKVEKITKGGVVVDMAYDANENLSSEIFSVDGFKFRLKYAYDGLDHLSSIQYPSGKVYELSPDALGRARGLTGVVSSVTYLPSGYPNQTWYVNGELTELTLTPQNFVDTIVTSTSQGVDAVSLDYDYDANGNATTIVDGIRGDSMTVMYDELNRLIKTTYPDATPGAAYYRGYDAVGNVLFDQTPEKSLTMGYDTSTNRLQSVTSAGVTRSVAYDSLGNIVSSPARHTSQK
jgi:hypothetical protein